MQGVFTQNYILSNSNSHLNSGVAMTNIVSILGSLAKDHSSSVGFPLSWFSENSIAWVLMDWHIKFYGEHNPGDSLSVSTWSIPYKRIQAHRSFTLKDQFGNTTAECMSKWVVINTSTRKLVRPSNEIYAAYETSKQELFSLDTFSQNSPNSENFTFEENISVNKMHMDQNDHVNNNI